MKRFMLLFLLGVVASACTALEPMPTLTPRPTMTPRPQVTATPAVGRVIDMPVPAGEGVTVNNMTVVVVGQVRPADAVILNINRFWPGPRDGHEVLLVELDVTCNRNAGQRCSFLNTMLTLIGNSEILRTPRSYIQQNEGEGDNRQFFGGRTERRAAFFEVLQDEVGFVLILRADVFKEPVYMALPSARLPDLP